LKDRRGEPGSSLFIVIPFDRDITFMFELSSLQTNLRERSRVTLEWSGFRSAAVLVPLLKTQAGFELLFTVRSSQLSSHAGEISFPGGRLDDGETIDEAARREAFEEIGLTVTNENILGYLDDVPSPAKYIVTPVVAVLEKPLDFTLSQAEVEEIFTADLAELSKLEPKREERILQDHRRVIHFYTYRERVIWGLTGNVLKNLLDVLEGGNEA
jgi:8-oxo-dGTP pyrophosphatase MutT (NUDIX family)